MTSFVPGDKYGADTRALVVNDETTPVNVKFATGGTFASGTLSLSIPEYEDEDAARTALGVGYLWRITDENQVRVTTEAE